MQHLLTAPNIYLVVAEINGLPVGCGYARIVEALHFIRHTHHAHLGFMYVQPQHRGKGVNKKIIEALKNWAKTNNLTEMRLEVYYNNTPAVKAYLKAGFTHHVEDMRMPI
jgi:GNAT superfamily N-acetyltransferase